jgi:hypothetical protein
MLDASHDKDNDTQKYKSSCHSLVLFLNLGGSQSSNPTQTVMKQKNVI